MKCRVEEAHYQITTLQRSRLIEKSSYRTCVHIISRQLSNVCLQLMRRVRQHPVCQCVERP